ncbi:hypothetical protein [Xanthobacter sediminis]
MTGPFLRRLALGLLLGSALAAPAGAGEAAAPPSAATLLFETPQLEATRPGHALTYLYTRKVSDPELGPSFDDTIKLEVEPASTSAPAGARTLKVDFFSAARHRAAGPFEDITGNPVLILFLENHLADLSGKLLGNPRYFKTAIRAALRDKAEVTRTSFTVGGRIYGGWRVKVQPFAGDPNARKMRGLDTLTYEFDVAPELPGEIVRMTITADAKDGRLWEEALSYDPQGT